jgi:rSAM/selenodomain-associated transferase 1
MSPTGGRSLVIVFARAPRPGTTKTRLIPLLGPEGAAALHARLIKLALATATTAARGAVELHGDPANDDFLRYCAAQYRTALLPQEGSDLGARMHHAIETALQRGCRSVVLIGSDCPALTAKHVRHALRALEEGHGPVFAPTEDGGYALVGLARADARLFQEIAWGTANVMAQTRDRLRELRWRWLELETLWDVDRPEDYERLDASGLLAPSRRAKRSRGTARPPPRSE